VFSEVGRPNRASEDLPPSDHRALTTDHSQKEEPAPSGDRDPETAPKEVDIARFAEFVKISADSSSGRSGTTPLTAFIGEAVDVT
jgi:hypothetical protein